MIFPKILQKDFRILWWEKFYSLLVSGKMLFFHEIFIVSTIFLLLDIIDVMVWERITISGVITIATMRGIVEIQELRKTGINSNNINYRQDGPIYRNPYSRRNYYRDYNEKNIDNDIEDPMINQEKYNE